MQLRLIHLYSQQNFSGKQKVRKAPLSSLICHLVITSTFKISDRFIEENFIWYLISHRDMVKALDGLKATKLI
jgi:hypothetical protein